MLREHQVADLIGRIYDAALDASLWPSVLLDLVKLTKSHTGNFAVLDLTTKATQPIAALDMPAKCFSDYEKYFWQKDIWTPKPDAFDVGVVYTSQQHVSDQELARSEFYHDWMKPIGLFHGLGGIPLVEDHKMFLAGMHRPLRSGRPYRAADVREVQRLFPHLKRAFQIHRRLDGLTAERDTLAEAADRLPRGVFAVAADGRLLWVNRLGEALCREADGFTIQRGCLATALPGETGRLRQLLHHCQQTGTGAGLGSGGAMLVSRPSGLRPYIALVSPLRAGRGRLDDRLPAAVVFVADPERMPGVSIDRLTKLYGLTRAEAELALQLAGGLDLRDIASAMGKTLNTLRTQLKQVFQKTGTARQAELVRLVMQTDGVSSQPGLRRNGHVRA
ncbi:helix-turn-helix transcriptional regulator [Nitrospira moscoviensis]|uniref:Putative Transcriptional regulator, LuxR family protein n=1 Tax=Nitrospira moscoviensis TaxID=42253 RepID=A0A0K2GHS7_NITMO|nr:helix-turn-helix transcriptional regulator [Nitrospira moscoviensis]ALA60505.1 putative Transcriptional regulator, LuxR family protein [Nitrospira moscoviensis]